MSTTSQNESKIPLPKFLKILTSNNVPTPKAMAVTGKIYKDFNTPAQLRLLSDLKLKAAGVGDKEDRRLVMSALRKAGYSSSRPSAKQQDNLAGPSTTPTAVESAITPTKKKRKRSDDNKNEFLPEGPTDEGATYGSLEFNEVLDEDVLRTKSTVINRAPLMTAWATIVAERMGFKREEALSIASVYTEMNAISKGVSIGLFDKAREVGIEANKEGSQPYVNFIGRRPLYQTQDMQWRALLQGVPAKPSVAFSYISRSFRQTTQHILGALRLLANTYEVHEINDKAWSLYADFRPTVYGWGHRAEVKCGTILGLRKQSGTGTTRGEMVDSVVQYSIAQEFEEKSQPDAEEPQLKKPRTMTLEEYEAALDNDDSFADVDLDIGDH